MTRYVILDFPCADMMLVKYGYRSYYDRHIVVSFIFTFN